MTIIPFPGNRSGSSRRDSGELPTPTPDRPNLAVASSTGREVDLHLGEAAFLLVFGPRGDGSCGLLGTRPVPESGGGRNRWLELAATLDDCFALLVADAGDSPRRVLAERQIPVVNGEGGVAGLVEIIFGGNK